MFAKKALQFGPYCKYQVAGRGTNSEQTYADRDIIIGHGRGPGGNAYFYCACSVEGCQAPARYRVRWTPKQKAERMCPPHALRLKRRIRPHEPSYNLLVAQAKKRGLPVDLTYERFLLFCGEERCHYCDALLVRIEHRTAEERSAKMAYFLDRKDPRLGYSVENCVPCCGPCNITKCEWLSYEEMLVVGAIRARNNLKAIAVIKNSAEAFAAHLVYLAERRKWRYLKKKGPLSPPTLSGK